MLRDFSGVVNRRIARLFPERRLILRSETETRYFRLAPGAQFGCCVAAGALLGWAALATVASIGAKVDAAASEGRLAAAGAAYEARIDDLTAETVRLADALSEATSQTHLAASRLAAQHATLSNAVASEQELASALQTHSNRLDSLAGEHKAALAACDATTSRLAALEAELLETKRRNENLSGALTALNETLDDVAVERDSASVATAQLTLQLDELSTEIAERGERQGRLFAQLEDAARLSLGSLETVFERSGVAIDPILSAVRKEYDGEGGPFLPADQVEALSTDEESAERLSSLMSDLEKVNLLRLATERMPFARPVRAARFTSGFGTRRDPKNGRRAMHAGIDLAGPRGTPIYSTAAGKVTFAGNRRGYGKVIEIQHAFGYKTLYAHLHKFRVKVGDVVERGDRIGDMGNTGRSTGTHLHYEVRVDDKPVNPAKYIEAARNVL